MYLLLFEYFFFLINGNLFQKYCHIFGISAIFTFKKEINIKLYLIKQLLKLIYIFNGLINHHNISNFFKVIFAIIPLFKHDILIIT